MKRLFTNLLVLSILITGIETLNAQTTVPALITSNQVWTISGSPYLINQNTYIDTSVSVKIMPGVEVIALNNTIKLQVDGELQALGTIDSTILIDKLQIELNQKATPYDSATGSGALFRYCKFTSPGVGKRVIYIYAISTRIESCTFLDTYYSVYILTSSQTSPKIEIIDCIFDDNTGTSFPIYSSGTSSELHVLGNTFNNFGKGGGMYLYGKNLRVLGNTFNGQNQITIIPYASALVSCNLFKNLRSGVELRFYAQDTVSATIFTHNTLDSIGSTIISDPMLKASKFNNVNQSLFNYNNFLNKIGQGPKVQINGYNPTPTTSESVNFKSNYWVTTDSATIDSLIKDYSDDINIFGRADFSGFLNTMDSTCGDTVGSSCQASYYLAVDTATPFNLFVINTSTGTTSNTTYTWDFGDGYTSNDPSPSHTYNDYGKYYLCVTLYNASENCSSTYCDSIGLDSTGMLLKNGGFTIHVIDEDELTSIDEQDFFGDIRIYPNPTGGKVIIESGELNNEPMTIRVFDLSGKTLHEARYDAAQRFELDLSTLPEGLYLLNLQKGQSIYTTKIVVNR